LTSLKRIVLSFNVFSGIFGIGFPEWERVEAEKIQPFEIAPALPAKQTIHNEALASLECCI